MKYVAIARKWRPERFEDIVGQGHVTQALQNAIRLKRVHHAYLFTGARGVGKTTAARVLSRALNCERDGEATPDPCGTCASCRDIAQGSAADVIEIDGASNNSVDDVRDLRESVRYLPQSGRQKIYIVDEVHMLSRGAFNALLKTLEEPPAHVVFIFATTEPHKIPDTILSRVQRFDFKRIPMATVVERLQTVCDGEGLEISEGGLRLIARAGEGSMRDSQGLLDRVRSFAGDAATTEQVAEVLGLVDRSLLYQMLEGVVKGNADRCLDAIDRVDAYGYSMSEFTSEMLELLRNATLVGLSPGSQKLIDVPDDERGQLVSLSENVASDVLVRSFHVMLDVHDQVARAPRPRMVLEMAVARLVSIRPARAVDQLLERVDLLQRRVLHQVGSSGRARGRNDDPEGDPPPPVAAPEPESEPASEEPPLTFRRGPMISATPPGSSEAKAADSAEAPHQFRKLEPLTAPTRDEHLPQDGPIVDFERKAPLPAPAPPAPLDDSGPVLRFEKRAPLPVPERIDQVAEIDPSLPTPRFEGDTISAATRDTPEDLTPPVPLTGDPSTGERFDALQRYLEAGGPRYDAIAFDAALVAVEPPVVRVGISTDFMLRVARDVQHAERVGLAVESFFSGCTRLETALRRGQRPETRRERLDRHRKERIAALTEQVARTSLHDTIGRITAARLVAVVPVDEAPVLQTAEEAGRHRRGPSFRIPERS